MMNRNLFGKNMKHISYFSNGATLWSVDYFGMIWLMLWESYIICLSIRLF